MQWEGCLFLYLRWIMGFSFTFIFWNVFVTSLRIFTFSFFFWCTFSLRLLIIEATPSCLKTISFCCTRSILSSSYFVNGGGGGNCNKVKQKNPITHKSSKKIIQWCLKKNIKWNVPQHQPHFPVCLHRPLSLYIDLISSLHCLSPPLSLYPVNSYAKQVVVKVVSFFPLGVTFSSTIFVVTEEDGL